MNGQQELDDLIMAAAQPENDAAVAQLVKAVQDTELKILKDSASSFELLFDAWDESVYKNENKATVCLTLAEKSILDSTTFRIALNSAIRNFLPPYLSSPAVAKAVGARDSAVSVCDVAQRIRKLQHLKTNAYVYQLESRTWGRIINIDKVVASLVISTFATGGQISVPLSNAVKGCYFFEASMEMSNIINTPQGMLKSAAYYREKLHHNSLGELSETKTREIIQQMFVPTHIGEEGFEAWWNAQGTETKAAPQKRTFRDARSLLELHNLLKAPEGEVTLTAEDAAKLTRIFTRLRPGMTPKDLEMLAECAAELAFSADDAVLHTLFDGMRGKVAFFPAEIKDTVPLKNLEIWGRIPVKLFPGFLKVAKLLYSRQELTKLSMMLPLRCVNVIFKELSKEELSDALSAVENLRSDVIVSIWKNRSNYPDEIRDFISMENICRALSEDGLPKEWTAAQRELKSSLFEKADFQKFVLANAGSNIQSIISPIQRMRNMAPGECQSLLVKLARHSDVLKAHIEGGKGKELLAAQDNSQQPKQNEALMTSLKSYKALAAELDNIVRVQIPENNKAIEVARGFGDFRENSEYDAAKERRNFLRHRRTELENLVSTVQQIDFLQFKADTSKVSMGTAVTLLDADGTEKVYSIVGVWDGDPKRNLVPYKTPFGEALLGAKIGDKVTLPEGTEATVKAIAPLAADLAKELSSAE